MKKQTTYQLESPEVKEMIIAWFSAKGIDVVDAQIKVGNVLIPDVDVIITEQL